MADLWLPPWFLVARSELGVKQAPGVKSNPRINQYLKGVHMHPDDEIPWCSAFVDWCVEQCGFKGTDRADARSWLNWGEDCEPQPGAIVVLWREKPTGAKGHVGFLEHSFLSFVQLLGGNQGDQVCSAPYAKSRVLGYRWPKGYPKGP